MQHEQHLVCVYQEFRVYDMSINILYVLRIDQKYIYFTTYYTFDSLSCLVEAASWMRNDDNMLFARTLNFQHMLHTHSTLIFGRPSQLKSLFINSLTEDGEREREKNRKHSINFSYVCFFLDLAAIQSHGLFSAAWRSIFHSFFSLYCEC